MLNTQPNTFNFSQTHESEPILYANLPTSFDWRQQNKVTPVKNQGQCSFCWAFATTATIEAHYAIKHNQFISLSEQQLVDCAVGKYKNGGCKGGWVPIAYQYVIDNGIETESDYPYHTSVSQNLANIQIVSAFKSRHIILKSHSIYWNNVFILSKAFISNVFIY